MGAGRTVIVEQPVLIDELAAAIGAGTGDQDRRGLPDAGVLVLLQGIVYSFRAYSVYNDYMNAPNVKNS